jgi:hypothetical protein
MGSQKVMRTYRRTVPDRTLLGIEPGAGDAHLGFTTHINRRQGDMIG